MVDYNLVNTFGIFLKLKSCYIVTYFYKVWLKSIDANHAL